MKNPTNAQIADALEKAAKKEKWGSVFSCPVCLLFLGRDESEMFRILFLSKHYERCIVCANSIGLFSADSKQKYNYCLDYVPPTKRKNLSAYLTKLKGHEKSAWRRAANADLLRRAKELRGR